LLVGGLRLRVNVGPQMPPPTALDRRPAEGSRARRALAWLGRQLLRLAGRYPDPLATVRADGVPWSVPRAPQRVVAVGDVHGDVVALASILLERGLIDRDGDWLGGSAHLVLAGDLIGGHRDARLLVDLVIDLGERAARSGGAVHALLGNHDLTVLLAAEASRRDAELFERFPLDDAEGQSIRDAFRGHTRYARWLRERNAIVRIGDTLFAHAGLHDWVLRHPPDRVNATVRAWIRCWQGVGPEPDPRTRWVVAPPDAMDYREDAGPLWTRALRPRRKRAASEAPSAERLRTLLACCGAARLVIGHSPTPRSEIALAHPVYGDQVVMIDTRISDRDAGRLSCLELRGDALAAHYPDRADAAKKLRKRLRRLLSADGG
jgi:hypothetical protein